MIASLENTQLSRDWKKKKQPRKNTPTDGLVAQAVRKQRRIMATKTPQNTNDTPPTVIPSREGDDVPDLEGESDDDAKPDTSQDIHHTGTEGTVYIEPQHLNAQVSSGQLSQSSKSQFRQPGTTDTNRRTEETTEHRDGRSRNQ